MANSDLSTVHSLYLMQVELWDLIESDLKDPKKKQEARKRVREFSTLLRKVDQRYLGGEDVVESLQVVHKRANEKLGKPKAKPASAKASADKKPTGRVTRRASVKKKGMKKTVRKKKK